MGGSWEGKGAVSEGSLVGGWVGRGWERGTIGEGGDSEEVGYNERRGEGMKKEERKPR